HAERVRSPGQDPTEPPLRAALRDGAHLFRRGPRLYLPRSLASGPFHRSRRLSARAHLVCLARVHPSRARRPTWRFSSRRAAVLIDARWFLPALLRLGRLVICGAGWARPLALRGRHVSRRDPKVGVISDTHGLIRSEALERPP